MNNKKIIKFLLVFFTIAVTGVFCSVLASDYKYKILDPKYNSSIEDYEYDDINSTLIEKEKPANNSSHPLRNTAIVLLAAGIPLFFIYRFSRVLKKIDRIDDNEEIDLVNEVFAVEKIKEVKKEVKKEIKNTANYVKKKLDIVKHSPSPAQNHSLNNTNQKAYTTNTITPEKPKAPTPVYTQISAQDIIVRSSMEKLKNPILLNSSKLTNNKGFCLTKYNDKYTLVGYINDKVFILDKFSSISSGEIRSRLSETVDGKDRYIVRLGSYKSIIEVSDEKMELLLEL